MLDVPGLTKVIENVESTSAPSRKSVSTASSPSTIEVEVGNGEADLGTGEGGPIEMAE